MESYLDSSGTEKWALITPHPHKFQKNYYVSSFGRMLSKDKKTGDESLIKGNLNRNNGYKYASYPVTFDKKKQRLLHRVVAEAFDLPKKEGENLIIHKDGNRLNNQLSNLQFITKEEHVNRTLRNKKFKKENPITYSKLNVMQVKRIKLQLKRGNIRKAKLARLYNVSDTQIKRIETGENWGHIKV